MCETLVSKKEKIIKQFGELKEKRVKMSEMLIVSILYSFPFFPCFCPFRSRLAADFSVCILQNWDLTA